MYCGLSLSMGFPRQEYWSGLPFLAPGDLPDSGIEPWSPVLQADSLLNEPLGKPHSFLLLSDILLNGHSTLFIHKLMDIGSVYLSVSMNNVLWTLASQVAQGWRICLPVRETPETWVQSLDQKDSPRGGSGNNLQHSYWKIAWIEKPGWLQFLGLQRHTAILWTFVYRFLCGTDFHSFGYIQISWIAG